MFSYPFRRDVVNVRPRSSIAAERELRRAAFTNGLENMSGVPQSSLPRSIYKKGTSHCRVMEGLQPRATRLTIRIISHDSWLIRAEASRATPLFGRHNRIVLNDKLVEIYLRVVAFGCPNSQRALPPAASSLQPVSTFPETLLAIFTISTTPVWTLHPRNRRPSRLSTPRHQNSQG